MLSQPTAPQDRFKAMENRADIHSKVPHRKIYVVVPVFNRKLLTERFLCCMRKQSFRNFEIIIVDDGSIDGTSELIAEQFSEVQVLRGDGTLWWTGAINLGISTALLELS